MNLFYPLHHLKRATQQALLIVTTIAATCWGTPSLAAATTPATQIQVTEIDLMDYRRQRPVKITLWYPAQPDCNHAKICLAPQTHLDRALVFSHGAMGAAKGYSWIGKMFAAQGYVTVGVNHYGESWVYGPEHVNPAAALQIWERPMDISFVLDQLQTNQLTASATDDKEQTDNAMPIFNRNIHWDQIIAVGHSSGGATVLTMAGSQLAFTDAASYCATAAAADDRSCHYLKFLTEASTRGYNPEQSFVDPRIQSVIALDPALGHAATRQSLSEMNMPVLVIGSKQNDFLPYERHAGYYAATIPDAQSLSFDQGEGHFAYLDPCQHAHQAMGVAICTDRPGVDRRKVHQRAAEAMLQFVAKLHTANTAQ